MNGSSWPSMNKDLIFQFISGFSTVPMTTSVIASINSQSRVLKIDWTGKYFYDALSEDQTHHVWESPCKVGHKTRILVEAIHLGCLWLQSWLLVQSS
jgi:hypothetical protein